MVPITLSILTQDKNLMEVILVQDLMKQFLGVKLKCNQHPLKYFFPNFF